MRRDLGIASSSPSGREAADLAQASRLGPNRKARGRPRRLPGAAGPDSGNDRYA